MIRRAGDALRGLDDAYAARIQQLAGQINGNGMNPLRQTAAGVVNDIGMPIADSAGYPATRYGMAPLRYALPAAGLTAAGAGVAELTQRILNPNEVEDVVIGSSPRKGPMHNYTAEDRAVASGVMDALIDGTLTDVELNDQAAAGMYTRPQLALITDGHDWSRPGNYPFGDQTIREATS